MVLFGVVNGIFRYFNGHIGLRQNGLAAETRIWFQTPSAIQQIVFLFVRFAQRFESLSHDDVASGAGAAHVTGVLDVDFVVQQGFANRRASRRCDGRAIRAIFRVGKDGNGCHTVSL